MIAYDCHMHSNFSTDSTTPMKEQIEKAISLGLHGICMTDHMDYEFPKDQMDSEIIYSGNPFEFDWQQYKNTIHHLQKEYTEFDLLLGVECGLQTTPSVVKKNRAWKQDEDLDYVIGSLHLVDKKDPYYPSFWEGIEPTLAVRHYFEQLYENLVLFSDIDALGHLDYIVRYAPSSFVYTPMVYRDVLEEIIRILIRKDIALEVNSSALKTTTAPNPHKEILTLYKELGGEGLTIGSDAHKPEFVAFSFSKIKNLLQKSGFTEYHVFQKRKAVSHFLQ